MGESRSQSHPDHRTQALFAQVTAAIAQLELEQSLRQQIIDQIFDSSASAIFRAVHTGDFIERLIEVTPSLTAQQQQELRTIADELIVLARQSPADVYERGRTLQQEARSAVTRPHALARFAADVDAEAEAFWEALTQEWQALVVWLRR